ncbi:MAG: hypothetical protein RL670_693 [Actinomycetota bacterium]
MTKPSDKRRLAPFVLLEAASIVEVASGAMLYILMPWLALNISHSSTGSGLMIALTSIPGLLLGPVLGSFVDRIGRRKVAVYSTLAAAATNLLIPLIDSTITLNLFWLILVGVIRNGIGSAMPTSRKALLPDVAKVGGLSLERANSIHEGLFSAGWALGPAIAAFTITVMGPIQSFYVVAILTLIAALLVGLVRVKEEYDDEEREGTHWFTYAMEGFKALPKYPAVFIIFLTFVILSLIYLPTEMVVLPRYYNEIKDPTGFGILVSTMAVFGTFGSLLFEQISKRISYVNIVRSTIIGVAVAVLGMSTLPPQPLMLLFGALIGTVWGPLPPLLNTVIQRMVPSTMRGRVFAIEITVWSAAPMISMFFVGLAVDGFGVSITYLILGGLLTIATIWVATSRHLIALKKAQPINKS